MEMAPDIWDYISRDKECCKLFELLPKEEIAKIEIQSFKKNQYLIENSQYLRGVFIMLSGVSAIVKKNKITEKPVILSRIGYLDIVGIYEYAWDIRRVGSVIARTDCTVAKISKKDIERWIVQYPQFILSLYTRIINRIFNHTDYLNYYVRCSTECALLSFLIEQYRLYERDWIKEEHLFRVQETRTEISEEIGREIRSVNRIVAKLKDEGHIAVIKGKIYISKNQIKNLINLRDSLVENL